MPVEVISSETESDYEGEPQAQYTVIRYKPNCQTIYYVKDMIKKYKKNLDYDKMDLAELKSVLIKPKQGESIDDEDEEPKSQNFQEPNPNKPQAEDDLSQPPNQQPPTIKTKKRETEDILGEDPFEKIGRGRFLNQVSAVADSI